MVCRFANKQIVRLQETPDAIPEGETPHTVSLCLYNTMVDAAKPGDRIEVCLTLEFLLGHYPMVVD
jgi:DNA replication licensing factor MCM4